MWERERRKYGNVDFRGKNAPNFRGQMENTPNYRGCKVKCNEI